LLFLGPIILLVPFLSSFDYTCYATCLQVVFELKTIEINCKLGFAAFVHISLMSVVFPVPVGPHNSKGVYCNKLAEIK
jgi:hypothetical protein